MALVVDMSSHPPQQQSAMSVPTTTMHPTTPKENVPPLPSTPKAKSTSNNNQQQRVEFAPSASFYSPHRPTTLAPQSSGGSAHGSGKPVKGILKPAKVDTSPVHARDAEKEAEKEVPPTEPIDDPQYVASPLRVLVRSLEAPSPSFTSSPGDALALLQQPTVHDLTETYALLLARLKHARLLLPPALEPLRENRAAFLEVLERDIARAGKPTGGRPITSSDTERSSSPVRGDMGLSGRTKKTGVSAEEIRDARDAVTLAHAAIKLLAVVFLQQPIHSLFSEKDLSSLLSILLTLPTDPCLPTPNPRRTNHYAMWALSNARISAQAVLPHRDRIKRALERGVKGELTSRGGSSGSTGEVVRGQTFEAMAQLLMHYPALLVSLTPLVSHVLSALLMPGAGSAAQARLKAASALAAYSLALKRLREQLGPTSDLSQREPLEKAVLLWLRLRRPAASSAPGAAKALTSSSEEKNVDLLEKVLKSWLERAPEQSFVLPTLSALLHIAGPSLLHAQCLKPLMQLLQTTLKQRALLGQWRKTWSVLIWSFGEGISRGLYPSTVNGVLRKEDSDRLDKAEKMIRQGISALVRAGDCPGAGELWTLMVRAGVLKGDRRWLEVESIVRDGGVRVLVRVLRPEAPIADEEDDEDENIWEAALEEGMWDGRASGGKLDTEPDCFAGLGKEVSKEEVGQSWPALVSLWWIGVKAKQDEAADDLLKLLCMASPSKAVELLFDLLTSTGDRLGVCAPRWALLVKDYVALILSSTPTLDGVGDRLVEEIGKREFDATMIDVACQIISHPTATLSLPELEALSLLVPADTIGWDTLKGEVLRRWCGKLQAGEATGSEDAFRVIIRQVDGSKVPADLFHALGEKMGEEVLDLIPHTMRNLAILAFCPRFKVTPPSVIRCMMKTLRDSYAQGFSVDDTVCVLHTLRRSIVEIKSTEELLEFVPTLEESIGVWIRDESELVPEQDYNDVLASLYTTVLSLLSPLPMSEPQQSLDTLAPFLSCAFYRMPEPGLCPIAFRDWWMVTFHGQESLEWPACLRPALRWWARSDGAFAMGLPLEPTQTQSHSEDSLVPETQLISDSEPERIRQRQLLQDAMSSSDVCISPSQPGLEISIVEPRSTTADGEDSAYQADISDADEASLTILHPSNSAQVSGPPLETVLTMNGQEASGYIQDGTPPDSIQPFTCSRLNVPTPIPSEPVEEIEDFSRSKLTLNSNASREDVTSDEGHAGQEFTSDVISTGVVLAAFGQDPRDLVDGDGAASNISNPMAVPAMTAASAVVQDVSSNPLGGLQDLDGGRSSILGREVEEPSTENVDSALDSDLQVYHDTRASTTSAYADVPQPEATVDSIPSQELEISTPPLVSPAENSAILSTKRSASPEVLDSRPVESVPPNSHPEETSEDEVDEASIEWSLSQDLDGGDDDKGTRSPVVSSLGKRKRTKSTEDAVSHKRPRSPSVELGEVVNLKEMTALTPVIFRPPRADPPSDAMSTQQVDDTFARDEVSVLSPPSTPIREAAQSAVGPALSSGSTSASARKRAGVFLECVEIETKRRKLCANSSSPAAVRSFQRPKTTTTRISADATSTPLNRFFGPKSKAPRSMLVNERDVSPQVAEVLLPRGTKVSDATIASSGKVILRRSLTDPSSSRPHRLTRRMSSPKGKDESESKEYTVDTPEERAALLLDLLKQFKDDVKHVGADVAETVQGELIEALHAANTNKKAKSSGTVKRRK